MRKTIGFSETHTLVVIIVDVFSRAYGAWKMVELWEESDVRETIKLHAACIEYQDL